MVINTKGGVIGCWIEKDGTTIRISELLFKKVKEVMKRNKLKFLTLIRTLLNYFNGLSDKSKVNIINACISELDEYKHKPPYKIKRIETYSKDSTLIKIKKGILSYSGELEKPVYFNDICLILLIFFCELSIIENYYKKDRGHTFIEDVKRMSLT